MTVRCFLMAATCLSCLGCQGTNPANSIDPATATADPPAAVAPVESAPRNTVVYAYYFRQTFRCFTCQTMEEMAARAIQDNFGRQIQDGRVVWMPVNIDTLEGKVLRQQFHARSSELVLARMENGVCKKSKTLDELWGLSDRPDAYSKHLVDQISAYLSSVQSG